MKLILPLKHYDEAGRVTPPAALYLCLLFLCRSILVFVGSISIGQYSKELLAIFYPQEQYLVLNLGIALPALMAILIISFREKLWQKNISWLFLMIKPLIVFSLILDFAVHVFWANLDHWQFSWAIAITLILDVMCLFFIAKDKHTRAMLRDWRMHPPVSTNSSWP